MKKIREIPSTRNIPNGAINTKYFLIRFHEYYIRVIVTNNIAIYTIVLHIITKYESFLDMENKKRKKKKCRTYNVKNNYTIHSFRQKFVDLQFNHYIAIKYKTKHLKYDLEFLNF